MVPAGEADRAALSDVLQAAFFDDPLWGWLTPDERTRSRRLAGLFSTFLRAHFFPRGSVWTTTDRAGAALWAPPGESSISPLRLTLYLPAVARAFGRHSVRALRALDHTERLHPKEPFWYLGFLGTTPARQGQGVGSAVLAPVLERCDTEQLPAYLESSKESNIPFYRRHGFEVIGETRLPVDGPPVWRMWREPRPS